ncbi:medium-chain fatty acid-CoA ligase faa2 [Coemansia sp. RSA 1721]|nr:medium-chain fatty acid-CoA ligase faa2 [Coemansia sp. RSA 1721]
MSRTFVVPSSETPGYSAIYRHPESKDGTLGGKFAEITNLYQLFTRNIKKNPKKEFLGTRKYIASSESFGEYEWLTTTEVAELVDDFGSGLDSIYSLYAPDVNPATGQQPLGIFSFSRAEWIISELSAFRSRRYSVGIADATGVQLSEFGMNEAEIRIIVCSLDKIPRMLERIKHTPTIKVIISMDKFDCSKKTFGNRAFSDASIATLRQKAESLGIVLFDMDSVIKMGRATPTEPTEPMPQDYCSLCFSSGTTGAQKGILLSHWSFVYSTHSACLSYKLTETTYLSYMSLSHIYERYLLYSFMHESVRVGFFTGDTANLLQDMQMLRPTVFATIPVLLNRIYDRLAAATIGARGLKGALVRLAYRSKLNRIKSGKGFKHTLWDKVIFDKVASLFGGQLVLVVSGAYYLQEDVHNFFRAFMSCNLIQGYGQTETAGGCTLQHMDDVSSGNIGSPTPGIDVRLRSIPDMGYNVTDSPAPRGELMIRAGCLFAGYYNQPEKTAETMDGEWLATGDIAKINTDGTISMIERINNVIKSGLAMWIEPEALETVYNLHNLVQSTFIYGNEDETELVAVVVPNPEHFVPWAQAIAADNQASIDDFCANEKVIKCMVEQLKIHAVKNHVPKPGMISLVHLEPVPLAKINAEFITLSFKIRRPLVISHYKQLFAAMYEKLGTNIHPQFSSSTTHAEAASA